MTIWSCAECEYYCECSYQCERTLKVNAKEETKMEKKVECSDTLGWQPVAGWISDIIKTVANLEVDGWHLAEFIGKLTDSVSSIEDADSPDEVFFIIDPHYYNTDGPLAFAITSSLDELLTERDGYAKNIPVDVPWSDKAKAFRLYTDGDDWGLDEIEVPQEEPIYDLVKLTISRIREVKETKSIYVAVAKDFGGDSESEASHYVDNSYCDDGYDWEEEDEFYNSYDYEVEVAETSLEEANRTIDDLEDEYEIEETLG